jgi:Nif-specific regulatory protein
VVNYHSIGRLLLETGRMSNDDYACALRESKESGKSLHEVLLNNGRVSVDELVQALTIHMDMTLLKEALGIEQGAKQPKRSFRPLGSYLERISLLFKMGILMGTQTNMSSLVDLLIREAPTIMNAERATIFLADHKTKELYSHVGVGLMSHQIRIPWESGIAGWVFTHGQSLNIANPYTDPRFNKDVDPQTGFTTKNLLCVPLRSVGGPTLGAFQVLNKRAGVFTSTDLEILEILASQASRSIEHAMEWDLMRRRNALSEDVADIGRTLQDVEHLEAIVGVTTQIREVRALIRKVAPTDSSVLIHAESGTGKELVAKAIHALSPRANEPMITLNCAAVPSELIESELFGHAKGSFTGAIAANKGVFRAAHKGTLFLDEIEATSPAMQVKLLRAIQEGEIRPVGENTAQVVDVRLVVATNQDLNELVSKGLFREDLFYRINVFPLFVPPLRERKEDIPLLIRHFLDALAAQTGKIVRGIDPAALDLLMRYTWPGNIRELENEIERAHILTVENAGISVRSLSPKITQSMERIMVEQAHASPVKLKDAIDQMERRMVQEALDTCSGNRSLAARRLGLSRQGLINKIAKFGLQVQGL